MRAFIFTLFVICFAFFHLSTTEAKRYSATKNAERMEVKCKTCTLFANNLFDGGVIKFLNYRREQGIRLNSQKINKFEHSVRLEENAQAVIEASCDNARTKLNRTISLACGNLVSDYGTDIASMLISWANEDMPSKFLQEVSMVTTLASFRGKKEKLDKDTVDSESLRSLDLLLDKLYHSLVSKMCYETLDYCPDFETFDTSNPLHHRIDSSLSPSSLSTKKVTICTQRPPIPPYPRPVSNGKLQLLTYETYFPFVSGQALSKEAVSQELVDKSSSFSSTILGVEPNTKHKDVLVYYGFPKSKCTLSAFPSKFETPVKCEIGLSKDNGLIHSKLFPVMVALAKLTKGFPFISLGFINGRMNSLPGALEPIKGQPALMLHHKDQRRRPQITADFSTFVYSLESVMGFITQGASDLTMEWAQAIGASFAYLEKMDFYTEQLSPETFKSEEFNSVLKKVLEITQAQIKEIIAEYDAAVQEMKEKEKEKENEKDEL